MESTKPGTAVFAFQQTMQEEHGNMLAPLSVWNGTFIDKFCPLNDSPVFLAQCWARKWKIGDIRDSMLARTWRTYPEQPDDFLNEPVVSLAVESARDAATEIFELSSETSYVVTIDSNNKYVVWQQSSHPSVGDDIARPVISFEERPDNYVETIFWLADMNSVTKNVANKLRAIIRYERSKSERHHEGVEVGIERRENYG